MRILYFISMLSCDNVEEFFVNFVAMCQAE